MNHTQQPRRSYTVAELRRRRIDADRRAAQGFSAAAVLAACASGWLSLGFAMAGDGCVSGSCPRAWLGGLAYLVTWGGIAGGATLVVLGSSQRRRYPIRWWPAAGLAMIVVTFVGGLLLANAMIVR